MSDETIRLLAGECSIHVEADGTREERGHVVVLVKPDDTVLVHDRDGYRPVAWLTRADRVSVVEDGGSFSLEAAKDDRRLWVTGHGSAGSGRFPATPVGPTVGHCPGCAGTLVRTPRAVVCLGCDARYGVPRDATVAEGTCRDCGLPRTAVERGDRFVLCVDRACDSLDDAVRDRFDGAWDCPACDGALRILRRGGLIAGCDRYPDCDVAYPLPTGTVAGTCGCGLPTFATASGLRCLDAGCPDPAAAADARSRTSP